MWWLWLRDAIFPERCIICKREGAWFCKRHNNFVPAPADEARVNNLDKIWAATAYYDPTTRKTVEFFKFRGFSSLSDKIADVIIERVPKEVFSGAAIVPIPLYWTRRWWRGFNQAEKITESICKKIPEAEISLDLARSKRTKQQAMLSKEERANNLKDAFSWTGKNVPRRVVLIDDVVASGGTLDAAASVLREMGVKEVTGVVFARGGKPCENSNNEN